MTGLGSDPVHPRCGGRGASTAGYRQSTRQRGGSTGREEGGGGDKLYEHNACAASDEP